MQRRWRDHDFPVRLLHAIQTNFIVAELSLSDVKRSPAEEFNSEHVDSTPTISGVEHLRTRFIPAYAYHVATITTGTSLRHAILVYDISHPSRSQNLHELFLCCSRGGPFHTPKCTVLE